MMVKWRMTGLLVLGIGAIMLTNESRAEQAVTGPDGCAVLARMIYAEVTADVWLGAGRPGQTYDGWVESGIRTCSHTTRTVSKAYASALRAVGTEFRWRYASSGSGDACLSGFLEQCYPERYPIDGAHSWRAVSGTIIRSMPRGVASDESVFNPHAMQFALRSALARDSSRH